ncbi:MAG: tetratricopeptide repeat protein, partial [Burkholderiaceae bacterium]|nr:tetratricopeptide repeat protein [Burkholderiaceae bacterium]
GVLWKVLGASLHLQGKDALHALEQASKLLPGDAESHNVLGVALHGAGRDAAALASYAKALKLKPNYADASNNRGMTLLDLGRYQEAIENLRRTLRLDPHHVQAHNNLGNALLRLKQFDKAVESYRRAIALLPQFAEAHNNLGHALHALGRFDEAASSYRRALLHRPGYAEAHSNLALAQQELGQFEAALESCRLALTLDPRSAKAYGNQARVLHESGKLKDALDSFAHAHDLAPDMPEVLCSLGNIMREHGRLDEAAAFCRRAIAAQPDFAEAYVNLGLVQRRQGLIAAAQESCRAALAIDPELLGAIELAAHLEADCGRFEEAEAGFRHAVALVPQAAQSWAGIAGVRKMSRDDAAWRAGVDRLLEQGLVPRKEASLRFALGKYHDDIGEYDCAFGQYRLANELTKCYMESYEPETEDAECAELIQTYNAAWSARAHSGANEAEHPVFVIGMPRSGTSLAEQIIASHPAAFGAGELPFWNVAGSAFEAVEKDDPASLATLAQRYLHALRDFPREMRVVDKMPANYKYVGLIHAAFPNARFIHMQRNPVDTCLSIYFQHFHTSHTYANDLDHLVHHYASYRRLMAHWRAVLPEQVLLDVPYESLVRDQEGWSRKMIEFLGLTWDERCLAFHECRRPVSTASNWQVRQKMNASSVERWRRYAAHIGPLTRLL